MVRFQLVLLVLAACHAAPRSPQPPAAPRTPADPMWAVLADDQAPPEHWSEAAVALTSPGDDPAAIAALRRHANPTLTELLQRRIAAVENDLDSSCGLVYALVQWEPATSRALAKRQTQAALATAFAPRDEPRDHVDNETCIVELTMLRAETGDLEALDEYAAWLERVAPPNKSRFEDLMRPLETFPMRSAIAGVVGHLFGKGSRWLPELPEEHELVRSMLSRHGSIIAFPALNDRLAEALADRRPVGQLVTTKGASQNPRRRGGGFALLFEDGQVMAMDQGQAQTDKLLDALEELPRGVTTVRVCDVYAWLLAAHVTAPTFRPFWPSSQRDRAVREMQAWLKRQVGVYKRPEAPRRTFVLVNNTQ